MTSLPLPAGHDRVPFEGPVHSVVLEASWLGAFQRLLPFSRAKMKRVKKAGEQKAPIRGYPVYWAHYGSSLHVWPAPDRDIQAEVN